MKFLSKVRYIAVLVLITAGMVGLSGCAGFSRTMDAVKKAVGIYNAAEKPVSDIGNAIVTVVKPDAEEEE